MTQYVQRYLSTPIVELASTLDRVAASGDYSTRAEARTGDEVGRLVSSFNAMLGWLQIIRTTEVDRATVERAVASIERNAQSQARLVEDLIELSRIVTGKLQLRTKPMDLRNVVEAALDVVRTAAAAKAVTIHSTLPHTPAHVFGDRDRLQQVIWNLLSNAVKFTAAGGAVTVELGGDARQCWIVVSDTGIGIPSEFLPHIFERFRQADQSTTREHGGLGLGLAIAKEITELHGSVLKASSAGSGQGSRFTLTLPRLVAAAPLGAVSDALERPNLAGKRVLVVDDDADSREIASKALAGTGATVTQAGSGIEALQEWGRQRFDVLICDLAMPGMDGYEVLRTIRRTTPVDGKSSLAIALTALASDTDREAVLAAGFDDHVAKPFNFSDLLRAVYRAE